MAKDDYNIGTAMDFEISSKSSADILAYIQFVDGAEPWEIPEEGATLSQLKDYYTKPAYKTNAQGKRVLARGPLATSLEAGLRDTVRIGKVKWKTIIDKNTGKRDLALDGTEWKVEDAGAPIPPIHVNCRCERVPIADAKGYRTEPAKSKAVKFRKSKSIGEAENWAQSNLKFVGDVSYTDLTLKDANEINKTMLDMAGLYDDFEKPFNLVAVNTKVDYSGAFTMGNYQRQGGTNSLYIATDWKKKANKAERYRQKHSTVKYMEKELNKKKVELAKWRDDLKWEAEGTSYRKYLDDQITQSTELIELWEKQLQEVRKRFNEKAPMVFATNLKDIVTHEFGHAMNADVFNKARTGKDAVSVLLNKKREKIKDDVASGWYWKAKVG